MVYYVLNVGLQLATLPMVSSGKTFQEVVEQSKNVEGVSQDFYSKSVDRNALKGGSFSGPFTKGPVIYGPIS